MAIPIPAGMRSSQGSWQRNLAAQFQNSEPPASDTLHWRRGDNVDTASIQFVFFGLAAALISNFSRSRVWRSIVLLVTSVVFLGLLAHNPIVFVPLTGFLLLGYASLFLLDRGFSKSFTWSLLAII